MIKHIITHDRVFHADETFAVAMLQILYPAATIERTRDPVRLQWGRAAPEVALLDVGAGYAPAQGLFDHHQLAGAGYRDANQALWPYATAGLVWHHYGLRVVSQMHPALTPADAQEVARFIDDSLVKYIDAVDCGQRITAAGPTISSLIASFNPAWFEAEACADAEFELVVELARVCLINLIKRQAGKVLARALVLGSPRVLDGRVLVLAQCMPWSNVIAEERPEVLLAVYPASADQWQVRVAGDLQGKPRLLLPAHWAGLEATALARNAGVPAATFCHRGRHLAGARNKEAALALAHRALSQQHQALAA